MIISILFKTDVQEKLLSASKPSFEYKSYHFLVISQIKSILEGKEKFPDLQIQITGKRYDWCRQQRKRSSPAYELMMLIDWWKQQRRKYRTGNTHNSTVIYLLVYSSICFLCGVSQRFFGDKSEIQSTRTSHSAQRRTFLGNSSLALCQTLRR